MPLSLFGITDPNGEGVLADLTFSSKYKNHQLELQTAELRRQALEQELSHRQAMSQYEINAARLGNEHAQNQLTLDQLIKQQHEFDISQQPIQAESNKASLRTNKAQARRAEIETNVAGATAGFRVAGDQLDLLAKQMGVVGSAAQAQAHAGKELGPADLGILLNKLAIKDPKARAAMGSIFAGQYQMERDKIAQSNAQSDYMASLLNQNKQNTSQDVITSARDLVKTMPEGVVRGLLASTPDDPTLKTAVMILDNGGLADEVSPLPAEVIGNYYKSAVEKAQLESRLGELQAGAEPTDAPGFFSRAWPGNQTKSARDAEIKQLQEDIKKKTLELQVYTESRRPTKTQRSTVESSKGIVNKGTQVSPPPPTATDEQLRQAVDVYKARGINVTFEQLKLLRDGAK